MQAIVKAGSSQHLVTDGSEILSLTPKINQIVAIIDGDTVILDPEELKSFQVEIEDLEKVKGEKIRVAKFKAKSRYNKVIGFRPQFHKIKIVRVKKS